MIKEKHLWLRAMLARHGEVQAGDMTEPAVLIVDDEPSMLRLCEQLLGRGGFRVLSAATVERAHELLQTEKVNLLLVEVLLPGMDGLQLVRQARLRQPDLAALMLTDIGDVEKAVAALNQGIDSIILKPFANSSELALVARKLFQESQSRQDAAHMQALRPLFDLSETLLSETNPDRLSGLVLKAVEGWLHSPTQAIYRRDETDRVLYRLAGSGRPPDDEESLIDGGPVGRADALGISLKVQVSAADDDRLKTPLIRNDLGAVICVPVVQKGAHFVFLAGRLANNPPFTDLEQEMFVILARQAAIALENARDYSDLKEYVRRIEESQRGLIQTEKMAAVGRLMASVAHEVNNPLQSIRNCLHLVGRQDVPEETRSNYLELAQGELERLADIVRRMLDFYRQGVLDQTEVDLNLLIRRVLDLLAAQLKEQNIRVETHLQENLSHVEAVSDQMQQVFFNLILNAMDAVEGDGEIRITSRDEANWVIITIEDTGPGIPEALRRQVFEPFVSTKPTGTGLGLTVSYAIMEAHGGSLQLMPTNQGASFRITIPIKDEG